MDQDILNNLRFVDDIFLCSGPVRESQNMLQELSDESRRMGLKTNITKTKMMVVDNTAINVYKKLIEDDEVYVYLEQHWSLRENYQDKEIKRR